MKGWLRELVLLNRWEDLLGLQHKAVFDRMLLISRLVRRQLRKRHDAWNREGGLLALIRGCRLPLRPFRLLSYLSNLSSSDLVRLLKFLD